MIIDFGWYSGQMSVDAECLILEMPIANYRKWARLFAKYGKPEDQEAFLRLLEDQIQANETALDCLQAKLFICKNPRDQRQLSGSIRKITRKMKRRQSMRKILQEIL